VGRIGFSASAIPTWRLGTLKEGASRHPQGESSGATFPIPVIPQKARLLFFSPTSPASASRINHQHHQHQASSGLIAHQPSSIAFQPYPHRFCFLLCLARPVSLFISSLSPSTSLSFHAITTTTTTIIIS